MAEFISPQPRPIDHCVLPVKNLDVAQQRLTALGFTVAPKGVHPFGTENACVYFSDQTFLEPLAQSDNRAQRDAARQGNMFAARDLAFRYRQGEEGFSALVFGTDDAEADHAEFVEAGFSGGNVLDFSRDFVDVAGNSGKISFRLAFAADWRAPDCFFFTCQRINASKAERSALQKHGNGVTRIRSVVMSAPRGRDFADFALTAANAASTEEDRDATRIAAANAMIELLDGPELEKRFGVHSPADPGLRHQVICFGVRQLHETETLLRRNQIDYDMRHDRVFVHPAPGQGAIFAFEEDA